MFQERLPKQVLLAKQMGKDQQENQELLVYGPITLRNVDEIADGCDERSCSEAA